MQPENPIVPGEETQWLVTGAASETAKHATPAHDVVVRLVSAGAPVRFWRSA
jgi:hypothetical protein